jgi:hypothetical protein
VAEGNYLTALSTLGYHIKLESFASAAPPVYLLHTNTYCKINIMAIYYEVVVGTVTAIYVSFQLLLHFTQDKREPPSLDTAIPFLSPIIGMSRKKTKYYIELRYVKLSETVNVLIVELLLDNFLTALFQGQIPPTDIYTPLARIKDLCGELTFPHFCGTEAEHDSRVHANGSQRLY